MASYNVAYGRRENILPAIEDHIIPPNTIILTEDSEEIFFYDDSGNLRTYKEKQEFESYRAAQQWVSQYGCQGNIITIHENNKCEAYIVNYDGILEPIGSGDTIFLEGSGDSSIIQSIEDSVSGRFVFDLSDDTIGTWSRYSHENSTSSIADSLDIFFDQANASLTLEVDLPFEKPEGYCVMYVYGEGTASFTITVNDGFTSKVMEGTSLKDDARGNRPVVGNFMLKAGANKIQINNATGKSADLKLTSLVVRGEQSIAEGYNTAGFGAYNTVSGENSMAVNYDNTVEAKRAFASGASNYIGPDAHGSFITGWHNRILNPYQSAAGRFNNPDPDAYFMVGNGSDNDHRNNAFTVCKDGSIKINERPLTIEDIITLLSLSASTEDMQKLTDNFNYLKSKASIPQSLYLSPHGTIRTAPLTNYSTIERVHKIYTSDQGGPSDVKKNSLLKDYTQFPTDSTSDRLWAWVGTTSSLSDSMGRFGAFTTTKVALYLRKPEEWAAFRIRLSEEKEDTYSILSKFYPVKTNVDTPLEIYLVPMTEERELEFDLGNTDTYGDEVSAGNATYPNQLKRTGAKPFSGLTSMQGESPLGVIDMKGEDATVAKICSIGEIDLSPGDYLLVIRALAKQNSVIFSEFYFNNLEFSSGSSDLGDIESALVEIREYAQSLIGGAE